MCNRALVNNGPLFRCHCRNFNNFDLNWHDWHRAVCGIVKKCSIFIYVILTFHHERHLVKWKVFSFESISRKSYGCQNKSLRALSSGIRIGSEKLAGETRELLMRLSLLSYFELNLEKTLFDVIHGYLCTKMFRTNCWINSIVINHHKWHLLG